MGKRWYMISSINSSTQAVISWIFVSYFLEPKFYPCFDEGVWALGLGGELGPF